MFNYAIMMFLMLCVTGCVAHSSMEAPTEIFTYKSFNAPLNKQLEVETGDAIFVEGSFIEGEAIKINTSLDLMIPGSMFIPFPAHIDAGLLVMRRITPEWKYFCAEEGKAAASFPGLGSVISSGDCVGVRISLDGTKYQWAVDNSNHNKGWGETIWTLGMSDSEQQTYKPVKVQQPFKVQQIKRIIFDGYYGKMLHFSYEDVAQSNKDTKQFTFDFSGEPVLIGIKGNQFTVHSADNVKMVFEWKKFN